MNDQPHSPGELPAPALPPETPMDAGSQALAEALRSSFAIVKVLMVLLVLLFLASGFFTVGPQERAILLRFGRPVGEGEKALLLPGLHWSFPYPIDESIKVSISGLQQVRSTVGWYALTPEQELSGIEPPAGGPLNPVVDGYALTADANIIHTRATLTYRIKDPIRYVFSFVNASNAVQNAAGQRAALRRLSLQGGRCPHARHCRVPGGGAAACDAVGGEAGPGHCRRAMRRSERPAAAVEGRVRHRAQGRSDAQQGARRGAQLREPGHQQGQRRRRVAHQPGAIRPRPAGERHGARRRSGSRRSCPNTSDHPALFAQQRLTETLGRVLTNVQDKIFLADSADGKPKELRLLLNREVPKPETEETKP